LFTDRRHGPFNTAREHGCHFGHPCSRAVNMGIDQYAEYLPRAHLGSEYVCPSENW